MPPVSLGLGSLASRGECEGGLGATRLSGGSGLSRSTEGQWGQPLARHTCLCLAVFCVRLLLHPRTQMALALGALLAAPVSWALTAVGL